MKRKLVLFLTIFLVGLNNVYAKEAVEFSDCVDGDTIKILLNDDKKVYTVRMLAVDTPESVHPTKIVEYYGKEASEYTCNLVTNAKKIEIEYDEGSNKTDKYDRLLVWVFVDGELLQKKLIENGYAKVAYLYDDYKYTGELEKIQELVSAKGIGIWNEEEKNKYNNENGITTDTKNEKDEDNYQTITEELTLEANSFITKLKSFKITDYILLGILLIIFLFCGNKTIKNKAKKKIKKYLK